MGKESLSISEILGKLERTMLRKDSFADLAMMSS